MLRRQFGLGKAVTTQAWPQLSGGKARPSNTAPRPVVSEGRQAVAPVDLSHSSLIAALSLCSVLTWSSRFPFTDACIMQSCMCTTLLQCCWSGMPADLTLLFSLECAAAFGHAAAYPLVLQCEQRSFGTLRFTVFLGHKFPSYRQRTTLFTGYYL